MAPPKLIGPTQRTIKRPALSDVSNIPAVRAAKPIATKPTTNATILSKTAAKPIATKPTTNASIIPKAAAKSIATKSTTNVTIVSKTAVTAGGTSNYGETSSLKQQLQQQSLQIKQQPPPPKEQVVTTTTTTTTSAHNSKRIKVQEEWEDLDKDDVNDPLMVSEYVVEIFEYLHELEKETMPNPNYMEFQKELQWKMRVILVDWLVEIHNKLRLLPETLFLTVNIVDRFLSVRVVSLVKLQLVGITSMFIAAKYEEICGPSIKNFIFLSDGGYSEAEMLKAERYILQTLDFKLSYPSPMNFLRRISKADNYEVNARTIAKYLLEVMLLDHRFLATPPSKAAAAALFLARYVIGNAEWHANLVHYSTYTEEELMSTIELLIDHLKRPRKVEAVYRKYSAKRFIRASVYVQEWINRNYKDTITTTENY
ncbi:12162_t:CDS:2, partial [Ambispora leptoticha]